MIFSNNTDQAKLVQIPDLYFAKPPKVLQSFLGVRDPWRLYVRGGQTFLFAGQIHKIKIAAGRTDFLLKLNLKAK